jgi:hypothetical protein
MRNSKTCKFSLTRTSAVPNHASVPDSFRHPQLSPHAEKANQSLVVSRRRFAQHAAMLAACSLSGAPLLAEPGNRHPQSPDQDFCSRQIEEVEAKLANIVRKYGSRLSEEQRNHLRHILTYNEKMLASVRSFPLQNGDPPASVLAISFPGRRSPAEAHRAPLGSVHASTEREEGNA